MGPLPISHTQWVGPSTKEGKRNKKVTNSGGPTSTANHKSISGWHSLQGNPNTSTSSKFPKNAINKLKDKEKKDAKLKWSATSKRQKLALFIYFIYLFIYFIWECKSFYLKKGRKVAFFYYNIISGFSLNCDGVTCLEPFSLPPPDVVACRIFDRFASQRLLKVTFKYQCQY